MPLAVRDTIDGLAGPVTFFFGSAFAFWAFFYFRSARVVSIPMGRGGAASTGIRANTFDIRIPFGLTDPAVMWLILSVVLLFFGFSMTDYDFRLIVAKPD